MVISVCAVPAALTAVLAVLDVANPGQSAGQHSPSARLDDGPVQCGLGAVSARLMPRKQLAGPT